MATATVEPHDSAQTRESRPAPQLDRLPSFLINNGDGEDSRLSLISQVLSARFGIKPARAKLIAGLIWGGRDD
jgi:hypothetical protein